MSGAERQYVVIAHTWNDGKLDYFNVLDNRALTTRDVEGSKAPYWLQERVALLRLCEVKDEGEIIGRRFSSNIIYVYLNKPEYKELIQLSNQGVQSETKETKCA